MSDYTPYDAYTMRKCIERQDAAIASLTRELDKAKEGLAAAIIHAGLATGHGDTVDDLLQELREQVARLTQELEEARDNKEKYYSVWLDRCKEVSELQAENAALKAKVERLRELLYRQIEIDYTSEDAWKRISKYLNDDNCKGFLDSSRKSLIALRTRLEQAEAELAAEKGKVEKVREWLNGSIINSCPECGQEIGIIDWNALEQILRGEP